MTADRKQFIVIERGSGECLCMLNAGALGYGRVGETADSSGAYLEWVPCPHGSRVLPLAAEHIPADLAAEAFGLFDEYDTVTWEEIFRASAHNLHIAGVRGSLRCAEAIEHLLEMLEAARRVRESEAQEVPRCSG